MRQAPLARKISDSFKRTTLWFSCCTKGSATTIHKIHPVTDRDYIKLYGLRNVNKHKFWLTLSITILLFLWHYSRSRPCNGEFRSRGLHFSTESGVLGGCNFDHPFLKGGFYHLLDRVRSVWSFNKRGFRLSCRCSLVFALAMTQF